MYALITSSVTFPLLQQKYWHRFRLPTEPAPSLGDALSAA